MRLQDIRLVALDADRATLIAFLDATPPWSLVTTGRDRVVYSFDSKRTLASLVDLPADDDPAYVEEDREMCATAATEINAFQLGLPLGTPREAVRRLIEIINLSSDRDPDMWYARRSLADIHAVATGREATR
ncbi:hypothetical protein ACFOY2_46015 [Nonomuraea purpurea]|uniref:Immunity protein 35 domain-containing protein n=1 Tax=Nonomuraea purpurea TaxID=1849276 RepID=A0ABV8GNV7_9ACTN